MTITAITCTQDRPEALALTELWMSRQTVKPDAWIVLDDGHTPAKATMGQKVIYAPECRGRVSMNDKLKIAFAPGVITTDAVVFIEDDDWVAPSWIETCIAGLGKHHIFGEAKTIYYNVAERWWFEHANLDHCSLCSTAVRREVFQSVISALARPHAFIDQDIWRSIRSEKRKIVMPPPPNRPRLVVGIKAMPGRVGYSGAHTVRDKAAKNDPVMSLLQSLLGSDAEQYAKFYRKIGAITPPVAAKIIPPIPMPPTSIVPKVPFHTETGKGHGPNWLRWLGHLIDKPGVVGLEIGTFKGDSAEFMCENIFTGDGAEYNCVDPFTGSPEHELHHIDCSQTEVIARARLSVFPQCKIIKGFSQDVLNGWKGKRLDAAYVDGLHTSQAALRDGVLVFEALKVGGVMIWDDYAWEAMPRPIDRHKIGVDAFLAAYADQIEVLPPRGWQIAIRKTKE